MLRPTPSFYSRAVAGCIPSIAAPRLRPARLTGTNAVEDPTRLAFPRTETSR